jgi:hypothetical protein
MASQLQTIVNAELIRYKKNNDPPQIPANTIYKQGYDKNYPTAYYVKTFTRQRVICQKHTTTF